MSGDQISGGRRERKPHGEAGAAAGSVLGRDGAAVGFGDLAYDVEAEAQAAEVAHGGAALEAFEDARELAFGEAGAGVADLDDDVAGVARDADRDRGACGVADRVGEEVG